MEREEALNAMREHVAEFIQLELTDKLEAQLTKLLDSGAIDTSQWDGVNLVLPRTVTAALLSEAASRVLWRSQERKYQAEVQNLRSFL
ncbi:hypothetical protein [Aeromonas sp. 700377]|uniref:hypothetical protein n=1 Tax=unclassified Aeromonas TaxID=257493 RepID=UPI003B9E6B67